MSDKPSHGVRALAGAFLDLLQVPDGPTRETLLDLANPSRSKVKEIIRKAVPDEKNGLRKLFKALDQFFLTDDQVRDLAKRGLDDSDPHTITVQDEDTRARLEELVNGHEPDAVEDAEPVEEPDRVADLTAYSAAELEAALANVRAANAAKTDPTVKEGDQS